MDMETIELRYGNTKTYLIRGEKGNLLVDTDMPGTMSAFFKEIKRHSLQVSDISFVLATHFHPDHMGLIGNLMDMGVSLVLIDIQKGYVQCWEQRIGSDPIDVKSAKIITVGESRSFLQSLGIHGEIIHTPSHSMDSICVTLDDGICIAGDLSPLSYLQVEPETSQLRDDWNLILSHNPKKILFAHTNTMEFNDQE